MSENADKKADATKTDAEPTTDKTAEPTTGTASTGTANLTVKPDTFPREYVEQLRSEAAAQRTARQEAEKKVEEFENANATELEKAQSKASKAEQKAAVAEAALLKFTIAAEKEVPADAVAFLQGDTREELEASADKLLTLVKNPNENDKADFDGGPREPAPESKTPEQAHNELILQMIGAAREQ